MVFFALTKPLSEVGQSIARIVRSYSRPIAGERSSIDRRKNQQGIISAAESTYAIFNSFGVERGCEVGVGK